MDDVTGRLTLGVASRVDANTVRLKLTTDTGTDYLLLASVGAVASLAGRIIEALAKQAPTMLTFDGGDVEIEPMSRQLMLDAFIANGVAPDIAAAHLGVELDYAEGRHYVRDK